MRLGSNRFAAVAGLVAGLVAHRNVHIDSTVDWVGKLGAVPLAEASHVEVAVDYLPGDEGM